MADRAIGGGAEAGGGAAATAVRGAEAAQKQQQIPGTNDVNELPKAAPAVPEMNFGALPRDFPRPVMEACVDDILNDRPIKPRLEILVRLGIVDRYDPKKDLSEDAKVHLTRALLQQGLGKTSFDRVQELLQNDPEFKNPETRRALAALKLGLYPESNMDTLKKSIAAHRILSPLVAGNKTEAKNAVESLLGDNKPFQRRKDLVNALEAFQEPFNSDVLTALAGKASNVRLKHLQAFQQALKKDKEDENSSSLVAGARNLISMFFDQRTTEERVASVNRAIDFLPTNYTQG
ncbi:MAG: hypothetical protein JKY15_01640 [Deltaproteobacteria bacterium]|nr:hypothetical protein [Deltaproteobacteria bacterium]